ncbi:MAG: polysaccharide deacetylase family protein [Lachnospiraceae bacterium]|nr:polysaccharide deacetylase family protein [Lachnospiraceae bacterium]
MGCNIEKVIDYCKAHKNIYCYGAGEYGKILRVFLDEQGIKLSGFLVTKEVSSGEEVLGISVHGIKNHIFPDQSGIIVCVNDSIKGEIISTLKETGHSDYFNMEESDIHVLREKIRFDNKYPLKKNIVVFCYHRITSNAPDTWKLCVKPELFDRQLQYIKSNYRVLRSEEDWSDTGNEPCAVITFDDGYEDMYTEMLPVLEKNNVPATVFVCTGNLGTDREFWWDELERIVYFADSSIQEFNSFGMTLSVRNDKKRDETCYRLHPVLLKMDTEERSKYLSRLSEELKSFKKRESCHSMNPDQLKRLSESPLITIGGHTVTHSCMICESEKQQEWEIQHSKEIIEGITGRKMEVFSYPFGQRGDFSDTTIRIASESGYKRIFAAFPGLTDADYINGFIPRINIGQEKTLEGSIKKLHMDEMIFGSSVV